MQFHAETSTDSEEKILFTFLHVAVDTLCAWQLQVIIGDAGQTLWDTVFFEASCFNQVRALRSPLVPSGGVRVIHARHLENKS